MLRNRIPEGVVSSGLIVHVAYRVLLSIETSCDWFEYLNEFQKDISEVGERPIRSLGIQVQSYHSFLQLPLRCGSSSPWFEDIYLRSVAKGLR